MGWRRVGHPGEPIEAGGSEEAKRVPALAPGVADPLVGLQDHVRQAMAGQEVPGRESRLAGADDHRLYLFRLPHYDTVTFFAIP